MGDCFVNQFPATGEVDSYEISLMMGKVFQAGSCHPMTIFQNESFEALTLNSKGLEASCRYGMTIREVDSQEVGIFIEGFFNGVVG